MQGAGDMTNSVGTLSGFFAHTVRYSLYLKYKVAHGVK